MTDDRKTDAFHPAQPNIPGVPASAAKAKPQEQPAEESSPAAAGGGTPRQHRTWAIAAMVAVCSVGGAFIVGAWSVGGAFFFWHHVSSLHASTPEQTDSAAAAPEISEETAKSRYNLPVGPGPIATTDELAKPWASKRFLFPDSVTTEQVTAMVVHLPNGSYWAFSLKEPFGSCALDYVTDFEELRDDYNFVAAHPMVVNSCNRTVYDLLRYGGPSDNSLVRGEVVQGPGLRPPIAIEVRVEGKHVVAVRME